MCLFPLKSPLLEVADAFQHYLLNTGATVCSTPQSYSSDLFLTVNFQWHFVAIQFSCANHFQSSAVKSHAACLPVLWSKSIFPTCTASWPGQPACISSASFSQESHKNVRVFDEVHFCPRCRRRCVYAVSHVRHRVCFI